MIKIITDSSAGLSQTEIETYGVGVVPLTVMIEDKSYLDQVELTTDMFYEKLLVSKRTPKTSQPPPSAFEPFFEEAKRNGDTVIALLISSKLSGTTSSARLAKETVDYADIHIVETNATIQALKLLVLEACRLANVMPVAELCAHLTQLKDRVRLLAVVDTLEYLKKGGRLNKAAALIGTLLCIKPVLTFRRGEVMAESKHTGMRRAMQAIKKHIDAHPIDTDYPFYYAYSMTDARVKELAEVVGLGDVTAAENIPAAVGVHTGPNAAAVIYVEKEQ